MIFVFDLDGTICFKGQPLDEEICKALEYIQTKGHEVIFASARPIRDILPVLPINFHTCRMVGGNGAFTFQNEQITYQSFPMDVIERLKNIIVTYNLTYLIDSDWDYSFTGDEQHPIFKNLDPLNTAKNISLGEMKGISKAVLFTADERVKRALFHLPVTIFEHHTEQIIDISPNGINKVAGLTQLGIKANDFIAFGNDQNDLELFNNATYSVCVGSHQVGQFANEQILAEDVGKRIKELADRF